MSTERNWLPITESVSIVASGVGTIAAAVYGQAAMAAVPLTAALALNFASRQRLREQMELDSRRGVSELGRVVELMRQEVEKLPKQQPDISPVTESILKLQELSLSLAKRQEELGQQFQTRSEIAAIAALERTNAALKEQLNVLDTRINNFPIATPVDLSGIEGKTNRLQTQLENLTQQFVGRPEIIVLPEIEQKTSNAVEQIKREINYLQEQLFAITQQFDDRIELQALPEIQQEASDAIAKLHEVETEVGNLNEQLLTLSEQFSSRTEIAALPKLQEDTGNAITKIGQEIANLRTQSETVAAQFSNRPEITLLAQLKQGNSNSFHKIETDISNLRSYIDKLSSQFNNRPEVVALPKIQQEFSKILQQLQEKINVLQTQLGTLSKQFSNREEVSQLSQMQERNRIGILQVHKLIEQEINYLREQMSALTEYFNNRPEIAALPQMQQETSNTLQQIKGEIGNLSTQLEALASQFDRRPELTALPQMQQETSNAVQQIEGKIGNLIKQLENLNQQFTVRPEIDAIANLEATVNALLEPPKLSNWPGVKIKAIGIGESGKNAIEKTISNKLTEIDFWLIDSDSQTLELSSSVNKLQIGESLTQGKGMGGDAALAKIAGEESRQQIEAAIQPADLVFIITGMGGGTGTGVAPIIAEIARKNGALTVAIVTLPFAHEGKNRATLAEESLSALQEKSDMLVVIPIEKVFSTISEWTPIEEAFRVVSDLEFQAVEGICNIINNRGFVNISFGDLKQAIASSGLGGIGIGTATGKSRAKTAAMAAISSPLMQLANKTTKTVILSINGPSNLNVQEVNEAAEIIKEFVGENANIILGAAIDERLGEEVRVTAIATGLNTSISRSE